MCWGILCSPSWYPIKIANQIIMTCCLIHNFIIKEMVVDPIEDGLEEYMSNQFRDFARVDPVERYFGLGYVQ
ncbi:hypothetical protein ACS0TY_011419 [Phlomoides rotata]